MLELVRLVAGSRFVIYGLRSEGHLLSAVEEYISGLTPREQKKIDYLLRRAAVEGPPRNEEKSKALHGAAQGLFEFKSKPHRLVYFYGRETGSIIVTHGFAKRGEDSPPEEIARALKIRAEYEKRG